jgi:cytochrome c
MYPLRPTVCTALGLAAVLSWSSAPALGAGGAEAFQAKCAVCHTVDKGGKNGVGPDLFDIVGARSGQVANFKYSPAFKSQQITWTDDKLKEWFLAPNKMVPGTKMLLIKPVTPAEADDIITFLKTKK